MRRQRSGLKIEEIYNYQATNNFKEKVIYGKKRQEDVMSRKYKEKKF